MALAFATPAVEVGIISVAGSPYAHNLNPMDLERVQPAFIDAYIEAGLDGLIFNMHDAQDLEPVRLAGETLAGVLR